MSILPKTATFLSHASGFALNLLAQTLDVENVDGGSFKEFTLNYDPSSIAVSNDHQSAYWPQPYLERWRIVTDLNGDDKDDLILSDTKDTFENATQSGWGGVWSMQELFKGTAALHVTPGNCEGGWGYNDEYTNWLGLLPDSVKTNSYTDTQLTQAPIFRPFDNTVLHGTNVVSLTLAQKAKVLGDGIPALSFAAGANPFGDTVGIQNVNMTDYAVDWPRERGIWRHSDIGDVAYKFLSPLFDMIVNESLEE